MSARSREALALRRWAWGVLSAAPGAAHAPPPPASDGGWRIFLAVERCALPLLARLEREGAAGRLPEAAAARLRAGRETELRRVLSARMQLMSIGRMAAAQGWRAVVLKGGVAATGGDPLDLADVDVLLPRDEALALSRALAGQGYAAKADDVLDQPEVWFHLAQRVTENEIQVEIHFNLAEVDAAALLAGALPLEGARGLLRPAPDAHLDHLLPHAALTHPYRRGALRDVLLIAAALGEMPPEARAAARARAAAHPHAASLTAVLDMAESTRAGTGAADPFAAVAAGNYLLVEHLTRWNLPDPLAGGVSRVLFVLLGDRADRAGFRADLRRFTSDSAVGMVSAVERRFPAAGRALHLLTRLGRYAASTAVAVPFAVAARRAAR